MVASFCSGVVDGVDHDVVDVVVGDRVDDLAAPSLAHEQVGAPQGPQVLGHQGLGRAGRLDEFVDAAGAAEQRHPQRRTQGVCQGLEQIGVASESTMVSRPSPRWWPVPTRTFPFAPAR